MCSKAQRFPYNFAVSLESSRRSRDGGRRPAECESADAMSSEANTPAASAAEWRRGSVGEEAAPSLGEYGKNEANGIISVRVRERVESWVELGARWAETRSWGLGMHAERTTVQPTLQGLHGRDVNTGDHRPAA